MIKLPQIGDVIDGIEVKESTKITGLVGYPLGHSVSPAMHNAAFKHLGLDFVYVKFEVELAGLKQAAELLKDERVAGFNVTVPHKETIMSFLDKIDDQAKLIGAVNTVAKKQGRLTGYNTDASGFIDHLTSEGCFNPQDKKVVGLGAGGAAKAVGFALIKEKVQDLIIFDIDQEKAKALAVKLQEAIVIGLADLPEAIEQADLLVNATPIGMSPHSNKMPVSADIKFNSKQTVYDLVYNPQQTKLLQKAEADGAKPVSGLGMLVHQGAQAFELFTGHKAPIKVMRQAAEQALLLNH